MTTQPHYDPEAAKSLLKQHLARIGAKGGKSKSERKREAGERNLKLARAAKEKKQKERNRDA